MADREDLAIARELGVLSQAVKSASDRIAEDRQENSRRLDRMGDGIESVAHRLAALEQSSSSTAKMVAQISTENCGTRLDRAEAILFPREGDHLGDRIRELESTIKGWQRWMGSGKSFVIRAILVLMGTSAAWSLVSELAKALAAKLGIPVGK